MKKENKKIAQQKKAEARKRQNRNAAMKRFAAMWLPGIFALIILVVIIVAIATSDKTVSTKDDSQTASQESSQESSQAPEKKMVLKKDETLVAKDGDRVNIDFVGSFEGEEFEGGNTKGAGYDLVLGSHSFVGEFEALVVGHNVGETFTIDVEFPEEYPRNPTLAGQMVQFDVTLNGIYVEE